MELNKNIYSPCYKIKLIDLGSFTYLNDIEVDGFKIKKNIAYPACYSAYYTKFKGL